MGDRLGLVRLPIFFFSGITQRLSDSCPGIPLMLSVLADVGGLMAGGLEGAWFVDNHLFSFSYTFVCWWLGVGKTSGLERSVMI